VGVISEQQFFTDELSVYNWRLLMVAKEKETWSGVERRSSKLEGIGFCPTHTDLISDVQVIKNILENIEKGMSFRQHMYVAMISLCLVLVIQVVCFSNIYGQLSNQVKINTARLDIIEETNRNK
jgi:hypothetical protein